MVTKENQVLDSPLRAFVATCCNSAHPEKCQDHDQTCSQAVLELLRCQFYLGRGIKYRLSIDYP